MARECRDYLYATEEKIHTRRKPTIAYAVDSGKMQQIAQDWSSETLDVDDKRLMGPVTDFRVSENLLYMVNAKGFFSIVRLAKVENVPIGDRERFLSATPLQAGHPMSIAIGEYYVCVLATP